MSQNYNFYDWFMNTEEFELCRALANERHPIPGTLSDETLTSLISSLWTMDEGHAASAVAILSHHDPGRLIPYLSRLLADQRTGVWCAAEGALLHIPKSVVTPEMVHEFRSAIRKRSGAPEDSYTMRLFVESLENRAGQDK